MHLIMSYTDLFKLPTQWLELGLDYPIVLGLVPAVLILRYAISLLLCSLRTTKTSTQRAQNTKILRKQMTPIGKFALASQTERNPSIITFFIALSNKLGHQPLGFSEFEILWKSRIMSEKRHERFGCCVSRGYFERRLNNSFHDYASEPPHPVNVQETKERIVEFLTRPIDVHDKLWQVELSHGELDSSGAILHSDELKKKGHSGETLALFRNHHCLCDGVSLSAAVADLSNESKELRDKMLYNVEAHKQRILRTSFIRRALSFFVNTITYYVFGSILALTLQAWNMVVSSNPFEQFMEMGLVTDRSVSWKYLASVEDAKQVTKSIKKGAKLNDLFVACLTAAIERQYECMSRGKCHTDNKRKGPTAVNLIVTSHLRGGIIMPDESIGNKIGAFAVTTPFKFKSGSSINRLRTISKALQLMKRTPAPQISYLITRFISNFLPKCVAQYALVKANCHSVATISNVHGFNNIIHWAGNPVEMVCAFLPLPTGIPIGIVITSYNGRIIMSVDANANVVPDADSFLQWMVEEYETIKSEATGAEKS